MHGWCQRINLGSTVHGLHGSTGTADLEYTSALPYGVIQDRHGQVEEEESQREYIIAARVSTDVGTYVTLTGACNH